MTAISSASNESSAPSGAIRLQRTVLASDVCIGCGVCAVGEDARFTIETNALGFLNAVPKPLGSVANDAPDYSLDVCPHSGVGADEDQIAEALFAANCSHDENVGYFQATGVFALPAEADRLAGSSGGGVTWLLRRLLATGRVDRVIHVKATSEGDSRGLFAYEISQSIEELEAGRKSAYYPITLAEVLERVRAEPGRYAVVAIPCFAKAIRRLAAADPLIAERITHVVGIVCGHLKSRFYAEMLGWSVGVSPNDLDGLDFRVKRDRGGAGDYGIAARSGSTTIQSLRVNDYFGMPWELGFMMYAACDSCDDVFAETADVVFGDAWVAPYDADWRGHNVVVSRRDEITVLLREAAADGSFEEIPLDRVIASQAGGLRHRRQGLAYRLAIAEKVGRWVPKKRVSSNIDAVTPKRAEVYRMRADLRALSLLRFAEAKKANSYAQFAAHMSLPVFRYYVVAHGMKVAIRQSWPYKTLLRALRRFGL